MVTRDPSKNQIKIEINVSSIDELFNYQKGLMSLLGRIQIDNCDTRLKENLKSVYKLLSHLLIDKEFPCTDEDKQNNKKNSA